RSDPGDRAGGQGSVEAVDILPAYVDYIRNDVKLARPMKVVIDCGNGVGGVVAQQLFEAIGCTVVPLYCEVDGTFPNHHPDPSHKENVADLIARVRAEQADLGQAFDGDADRVGVLAEKGTLLFAARLLTRFAGDGLARG